MKQYLELLQSILDEGIATSDRTGVGTISKLGCQLKFDLRHSFPLLTVKPVPLRWVFEELMWFLRGDTNEKNLRAKGVDIWQEWATSEQTARFNRSAGDLGPVYGYLWRNFGGDYPQNNGFDQLADLFKRISETPDSRRLIISGWNPAQAAQVTLPPCHTLFIFTVRGRKLTCHLFQRSLDSINGFGFNLACYALLTHLIAHCCNLEPFEFIHTIHDAHIYLNHLEQTKEILAREPLQPPTLELVNAESLKGLEGLLNFKYENIKLSTYRYHPKIKTPVAV